MRNPFKFVLGLSVMVMWLGASAPAQADSVGPYYATPSWDQTLPAATRFIVLSNFAGAAVLDRNTGLVWEKSPDPEVFFPWENARSYCINKVVGGQKGWRLPSIPELSSLVDPGNSNPALPTGHPFLNVQLVNGYWSATSLPEAPTHVWGVNFNDGEVLHRFKADDNFTHAWCVRGGMNADQY